MATTPRAGIINLGFKDVSEMAKNIADNDPWKLGIDAAGKVLTDRERYVMYQRALADAQGKERPEDKTAGELIGSGIDKAGEGASWIKDKWDRLDIRSPFEETLTPGTVTESPITETPSEKGSREMIGYKPNQSPIETDKYRTNLKAPGRADVQPNDELSFGFSQDVGQAEEKPSPIIPFATGEQIPEQTGTKVDFGTSEPTTKLRSPFAMRPKEEAQEVVSPFGSTEVAETKIKAPRMLEMEAWSEMNRLDPQRAAFDYNRVKNEQVLENELAKKLAENKEKSDINSATNIKEMAVQFRNYAMSIGSTNWNNFSDTQKKEILAGYNGLRTQLSKTELGRALIGQVESEIENDKPKEAPVNATLDSTSLQRAIDSAFATEDNPKTVTVEGLAKIKKLLIDARIQVGVPENDPTFTTLMKYISDVAEQRSNLANEKKEDVKESQQRASQQFSQYKDFYPSYKSVVSIRKDPLNATNVQLGVSELLKILSGTGVSDKERANTILSLTPTAYQEQMRSKAASIGKTIADVVLNMDQIALAEYSKNVDPNALAKQLGDRIPPEAWKWAEKQSGGSNNEPTRKPNESITEFRKRYKAWEASKAQGKGK